MFLAHRNNEKRALKIAIIKMLALNPIQICWLVYGNILYYSFNVENECGSKQSDISRLATFVLIVLIVGYIQLIYFVCSFVFLLYIYIRRGELVA